MGTRAGIRRWIVGSRIASLALATVACGPEVVDEDAPLGVLEYGGYLGDWYRIERRIEYIPSETPHGTFGVRQCGILTEQAYAELEETIAALDPTVDYDFGVDGEECSWFDALFVYVYLEDFEHSPFSCSTLCCRNELANIASTYFFAGPQLGGEPIVIEGEARLVVDEEDACE